MKEKISKNKIEALVAIAEYATSKDIIDKNDIEEVDKRLDILLASLNENIKFFKRLA